MGDGENTKTGSKESRIGFVGFESLMIILSVLVALFVDDWREEREKRELADEALATIITELKDNRTALEKVIGYHRETAQKFAVFVGELEAGNVDDRPFIEFFGTVATRGIQRPDVRRTAWNLNSGRGAIAEFDYETAYQLAGVYDLQGDGVDYTWRIIAEKLTSREALDPASAKVMAQAMVFAFSELTSQERSLIFVIDQALEKLGQSNDKKISEGA